MNTAYSSYSDSRFVSWIPKSESQKQRSVTEPTKTKTNTNDTDDTCLLIFQINAYKSLNYSTNEENRKENGKLHAGNSTFKE